MFLVRRVWDFTLDGVSHQVVLQQRPFAPYEILLNDGVIYKGDTLLPVQGIYHAFQVSGRLAEVWMVPGLLIEEHYLRIDGEFVFFTNYRNKAISKKLAKSLEDQANWEKTATALGLEYRPYIKSDYAFRHRMIGYFFKFPVIAGIGLKPVGNVSFPGFFVVIQHYPLDDEKIETIKKSDSLKQFLKSVGTHRAHLEITPNFTSIFVPFRGKVNEMGKSTVVQDFLNMITPYLYHPQGRCQGVECKNPVGESLDFVIINGIPWLMCADCIANIPNVHKKMEQEYKQAPHNLGRGLLYGAGAAVLGSILWALVIIFWDQIVAIFAVAIFWIVMMAMDKAETKRTLLSVTAAGVISVFGVFLGDYLGVVGYLVKEREIIITFDKLFNIFVLLFEDGELLRESLFFALLGVIPYGLFFLHALRWQLKNTFVPDVEVFENLRGKPWVC